MAILGIGGNPTERVRDHPAILHRTRVPGHGSDESVRARDHKPNQLHQRYRYSAAFSPSAQGASSGAESGREAGHTQELEIGSRNDACGAR